MAIVLAKVWKVVNARHYTLPQRRNRVWGIATLITGREGSRDNADLYNACMDSMKTTFQFPLKTNFPSDHTDELKEGLHTYHVKNAEKLAFARRDLFVDCQGSSKRPVCTFEVAPCLTRTHQVWSVELSRYLDSVDLLNCQGLWKSAFSDSAYREITSDPTFSHCLAGNSFASTVVQAVFISTLVACPLAWESARPHQQQDQQEPAATMRRVTRKRKAPEYDHCLPCQGKGKGRNQTRPKRRYQRRNPETDSRKNNKGKSKVSSIWDKEQVCCPQLLLFPWAEIELIECFCRLMQ